MGGGSRLLPLRSVLKEAFNESPLILTVNLDEFLSSSCSIFQHLLTSRKLHLSPQVLEYMVFCISELQQNELRSNMDSRFMSEEDITQVNLSNHAILFFSGLEDDTIPLQERKVNQDILHRIHFEESELNVINEEIRMVESLFLDEYQYKASPESCSNLRRFFHKKRCDITLSEVREIYHQMKVELGKEDSSSILSQEWNRWFSKHQSDANMTILDNSFSMSPSTDLKITSLSTLQSLRIGNHCFQDFLSFSLSGHPYLTSILIFSDSFTSEEGGAFSIFDCPALQTLEIRSNSFTHFQSFRIYSMPIELN